jgi:hypothetical protein
MERTFTALRRTLVEAIQFVQFLNCRKVAESWSNVCRSFSKKSANLGIAEFYNSPATCQKFDIND